MKKISVKKIKTVEELDTRSFNIYQKHFGNIKALLDYYYKNGNFLNIKNSGFNTNNQLISLCRNLQISLESTNSKVIITQIINDSKYEILELYSSLKKNLSVKTNKILGKIENGNQNDIEMVLYSIISNNIDIFSIRNCGKKDKIELLEFLMHIRYFISKIKTVNANANFDKNLYDSKKINFDLYQSLKINLSPRAKNILSEIEISKQIDFDSFFLSIVSDKFDFSSIRKYSNKVKRELKKFAFHLKKIYKPNDNISYKYKISNFNQTELDIIAEMYLNFKNDISIRAFNVLNKIEKENYTDFSVFLNAILQGEIDFLATRNCGVKTKHELQSLTLKFREFYSANFYTDKKIKENNEINLKITLLFPNIPNQVIELIVINQFTYDLIKLICAAIYFNEFRDNKKIIIKELFNSESTKSIKQIAHSTNLSMERVRQLLKEIYSSDIKLYISRINKQLSEFEDNIYENDLKSFVKIQNVSFDYLGLTYFPNNQLLKCIYDLILGEDFENCLDLYRSIKSDFNVFNENSLNLVYISKKFIHLIDFHKFIVWIEEQLYIFSKHNIEYDLDVLILRYFNREPRIDINLVKLLGQFIKQHKLDFSGTAIMRKGEREIRKMDAINLCYSYIEEINQPVKTNDLLNMLFKNGIKIEKYALLKLLNNKRDQFSTFGSGNWALASWRSNGLIGGSLRDIVISLLNNNENPLHISEIMSYLVTFKPVTLKSLLSNLRSANNGIFIFFNCNFIGSQSINYDPYWYSLPKTRGIHFNDEMLKIASKVNRDIPEYYLVKYGYPKINTVFLLNQKIRIV